jgi:hypothetical protein
MLTEIISSDELSTEKVIEVVFCHANDQARSERLMRMTLMRYAFRAFLEQGKQIFEASLEGATIQWPRKP